MSYLKSVQINTNSTNVDAEIIYELVISLKTTTKELLLQAHKHYIADTTIQKSQDEETITACIFGKLEGILDAENLYSISIVAEPRNYTGKIIKGKVSPKKAKRFDMLFMHTSFNANRKFKFIIEAKVLCHTNTSTRNATRLQDEYVNENGMGRFIKGSFQHEGFMLGYLLNGIENIMIDNLNKIISNKYSPKHNITSTNRGYISKYTLKNIVKELGHIFVNLN
jgi:hypothetical protein